jgi:hypothetical protein
MMHENCLGGNAISKHSPCFLVLPTSGTHRRTLRATTLRSAGLFAGSLRQILRHPKPSMCGVLGDLAGFDPLVVAGSAFGAAPGLVGSLDVEGLEGFGLAAFGAGLGFWGGLSHSLIFST